MDVFELDEIEASLLNPNDPVEVNIVVDAAGVGKTHRLSTGEILTWTAEKLRQFAPSMKGMPINVMLNAEGDLGGHSRQIVGAFTESEYLEAEGVVRAKGSLWPHYAPKFLARLRELFPEGKVKTSMEFTPTAELQSNADGSETPTEGRFSGLGLVRANADPRSRALLLASAEEDLLNQPIEVSMNLDQLTELVATKMGFRQPDPTFKPDLIEASDTDQPAPTDDAPANREAPDLEPTNEELRTTLRAELQTEFEAQIATLTTERDTAVTERDTLATEKAQQAAEAAKQTLAASRVDELDKIVPAKDEDTKASRLAQVADLPEPAFESLKAAYISLAEVHGGIASDADPQTGDAEEDEGKSPVQLAAEKMVKDIRASAEAAKTPKEK